MFCCTLLYVPSTFAITVMGKRELDALLGLSSLCLVIAVWLFLAVPWVFLLQFVIVVIPDHTHLLSLFLRYSRLCQRCKWQICHRSGQASSTQNIPLYAENVKEL